ncbi:hypothetical protein E2R51_12015 [Jeotgalibacillus sp. S-D1]|uniref:hypothetical protein n=1 Tax=Jeotgalibacillus sp. S-D1 TaxID=2552189 RepID=UPI00105A386B|nr:hypothetical protein [Jeotgalibacillus sp. S-D1]TDL31937.1 hypothetical protein E2R51_12015 [Jeotgalibacillus sp. S-D1]
MNKTYKFIYLIPSIVLLFLNNFFETIEVPLLIVLFLLVVVQLILHIKLVSSSNEKNHYANTTRAMVTISVIALILRESYLSVLALNFLIIPTIILAVLSVFTFKNKGLTTENHTY